MVGTYTIVLQSPSYEANGTGTQIPLPASQATHQGQGLLDILNLIAGTNINFELGKLKEGIQISGALTDAKAANADPDGQGNTYNSALAMRDAIRRTRTSWPSETASGTWDSGGLPTEEQDASTSRSDGKVRLILDKEDTNNDGTLVYFFLYGFIQSYTFRQAAPTQRSRILFTVSFVPAKLTISAVT